MPSRKNWAEELRETTYDFTDKQCRKDAGKLYKEKLLPAARKGEFYIVVSPEEMKELKDNKYRVMLINVLEEKGFKVTVTRDRDEGFLEISWSEE